MVKPTAAFFSMSARGTVANTLTAQQRAGKTILRTKPTPKDTRTLPQIYHRWDYQDYATLWHDLSTAEKQAWETNARPFRITGFNYWMQTKLTNLPDLAGRWTLDRLQDGKYLDSSKNTNHGTPVGATPAPALIAMGIALDGADDHVNCGTDNSLACPILLIEFFLYLRQVGQWQTLLQFVDDDTQQYGYQLFIMDTNHFRLQIRGDDLVLKRVDSPNPLLSHTWYHLAALRDDIRLRLYINGTTVAAEAHDKAIRYNTQTFAIGDRNIAAETPNAIIDHLVVYNSTDFIPLLPAHSLRRYPS